MIGKMTGKVLHFNLCEHCVNYRVVRGIKGKSNDYEFCALDAHRIPEPRSFKRYCEKYREIGCDCETCATNVSHS